LVNNRVKKIPELDGIRGMAILMVIVWHYFNGQLGPVEASPLASFAKSTSWCWSGVDLFFVLSGFLIGGIIIDKRDSDNFLRVFFTRRALRIIPVYGLLLIAFFTLRSMLDAARFGWLFNGDMPDGSYLTFTQNIFMGLSNRFGGNFLGVTWSLAVEEQFYLIVPFLCLAFPRKRWLALALLLSLSAVIFRFVFPGFHTHVITLFRMDALFLGGLAAGVVRNPWLRRYLSDNTWILHLVFLALIIPVGIIVFQGKAQLGNHALFAGLYTSLIMIAVLESGKASVLVFRMPVLRFFGFISYGLYLFHQPVAGLLYGITFGSRPSLHTGASWIVTLLSFVVSVFAAVISYFLIEQYCLRLGRSQRYEKRQEQGTSSVPKPELPRWADQSLPTRH
jgi:peptidoglycan/LPS O-acetylase OafA/YrhL